jgi:hypothetical protein
MAVIFHINKESGLIDVHASGVLTTAEVLQMHEQLLKNPDYDAEMPVLTDMTEVHTLDISVEGVVEIFSYAETHKPRGKMAKNAIVVTDQGQVLFAKMAAALSDRSKKLPKIRVFESRLEALEWLGIAKPGAISA